MRFYIVDAFDILTLQCIRYELNVRLWLELGAVDVAVDGVEKLGRFVAYNYKIVVHVSVFFHDNCLSKWITF